MRLLAQIDEPPYDVTQQSAQRGPLGDTWYNHLGSNWFDQKKLGPGVNPMNSLLTCEYKCFLKSPVVTGVVKFNTLTLAFTF